MSSDNGQNFIKRNRPPRVQISYQNPGNAQEVVSLPFVMGVLSDLSGNASRVDKPGMEERKFSPVDMDNFDDYMRSVEPAVSMNVSNRIDPEARAEKFGVSLTFRKMSDFEPAAIARQVPELRVLLEAREQLSNLQRYMNGRVDAEAKLRELLSSPDLMKALSERSSDNGIGSDGSGDSVR
ncbi:type VI secretion system contractile sheath small subunit [Rhizobium sp. CSW-27]|uniref:type VI secretion system contractile sheath small subunit n=1 Tax=Rhizobium sp. CSW-27 TaxID=2839985 RepID=UPI001C029587|nr:type VI secretion system contractile sheath small subunit [Rhizobium sp. CSW-27]MBT9373077.1 type VI secretion system contractile sheath small subunit [Rhizobium sp. CSW-27]